MGHQEFVEDMMFFLLEDVTFALGSVECLNTPLKPALWS